VLAQRVRTWALPPSSTALGRHVTPPWTGGPKQSQCIMSRGGLTVGGRGAGTALSPRLVYLIDDAGARLESKHADLEDPRIQKVAQHGGCSHLL
jgi:hypothetical protein